MTRLHITLYGHWKLAAEIGAIKLVWLLSLGTTATRLAHFDCRLTICELNAPIGRDRDFLEAGNETEASARVCLWDNNNNKWADAEQSKRERLHVQFACNAASEMNEEPKGLSIHFCRKSGRLAADQSQYDMNYVSARNRLSIKRASQPGGQNEGAWHHRLDPLL